MNSGDSSPVETASLVFVPAPFSGHIRSTVAFANLLADRHPRLSVTIFIMHLPFDPAATAYAHSVAASLSPTRTRLVHLPPSALDVNPSSASFLVRMGALIEKQKQPIRRGVVDMIVASDTRSEPRLAGFVVDYTCLCMTDVADEFGVPTYMFFAGGASFLGLALHLPTLEDDRGQAYADFVDAEMELEVPAFSVRVPAGKVLPSMLLDKQESAEYLNMMRRFREPKGILVNTFHALESHAVESLQKAGRGTPPVYVVGPVLNLEGDGCNRKQEEIQGWLDQQPALSVVFLCFGSMGYFDAEQVREIARGVELSGHRFLWSLRRPPRSGNIQAEEYPDPEEVLPEGFLKRTAEMGRVIGWAAQMAVLSHPSVGGFVSHCGWNSVVESVWFGVPIATWPLYAEQQVNAFLLARVLGLATEITVEYRNEMRKGVGNFVVRGEEVRRGIREVMGVESEWRKKVREMREESRKAIEKGGSSYRGIDRFVDDVMRIALSR